MLISSVTMLNINYERLHDYIRHSKLTLSPRAFIVLDIMTV